MKITKRIAALALSATLALTLSPMAAFADSLASADAGSLTTQKAPVSAQAKAKPKKTKMKTVYVMTKIRHKEEENHLFKYKSEHIYSYNKNGLLSKVYYADWVSKVKDESCKKYFPNLDNMRKRQPLLRTTLSYKGKNLTKIKCHEINTHLLSGLYSGTALVTSKNGLPIHYSYIDSDGEPSDGYTLTYNKKGQLVSKRDDNQSPKYKTTYKYNKAGQLVMEINRYRSLVSPNSNRIEVEKRKFAYNKHGDAITGINKEYKNGLMMTNGSAKYSYKKIKVPATYAKTVQRQQWAMRNGGVPNGALGPGSCEIS